MNFPYVALFQHGGLPRLFEGAMAVTNYPDEFVRSYIENHHYVIDPVYQVSERIDRPFGWGEIPTFVDLTQRQLALFEEARRYGIVNGITVPLRIPSESYASCSFAGSEPIDVTPSLTTTLEIVAGFGFKAALRLHRPKLPSNAPKLTRREAECTALVALGKSDWEISKILGLSQSTVRYFVSAAKRRYGVYKRSELASRCSNPQKPSRRGHWPPQGHPSPIEAWLNSDSFSFVNVVSQLHCPIARVVLIWFCCVQ